MDTNIDFSFLLEEANKLNKANQTKSAINTLDIALGYTTTDEEKYKGLFLKATWLKSLNKSHDAIKALECALKKATTPNEKYTCLYGIGVLSNKIDNYSQALDCFIKALSISKYIDSFGLTKQLDEIKINIIKLTIKLNNHEQMIEKIKEFKEFEETNKVKNIQKLHFFALLAYELTELGKYNESINLCNKYLSDKTTNPDEVWQLQYQIAIAYKEQKKYNNAIKFLIKSKKNIENNKNIIKHIALHIHFAIVDTYVEKEKYQNNPSNNNAIKNIKNLLENELFMEIKELILNALYLLRSMLSNPRLSNKNTIKQINELIDKIIQNEISRTPIKDYPLDWTQDHKTVQQQIYEFIGIEYLRKFNYAAAFAYFKHAYNSNDNYLGNFNLANILSNLNLDDINKLDVINLKDIIKFDRAYSTIAKEADNQIFLKFYLCICKIIALSSVKGVEEKKLAHYTAVKNVGYLLPEKSVFRLSSTAHLNDPSEGKTLFSYIKNCAWKEIHTSNIRKLQAFIACFSFNHNHLNQFRLYGTTDHKAASGVSLVFKRDQFFKQDRMDAFIKMDTLIKLDTLINKDNNNKLLQHANKKHHLFRCIYIDPLSLAKNCKLSITLAQRERHTFAYNEEEHLYKKYNEDIRKKTESIYEEFQSIKSIYDGESTDVKQILDDFSYQLSYLVKDIAFKEEQECRCIGFEELSNNTIVKEEGDLPNRRYYIETQSISSAITKIWIGPQCHSLPVINELVARNNLEIKIEQSQLPIRD